MSVARGRMVAGLVVAAIVVLVVATGCDRGPSSRVPVTTMPATPAVIRGRTVTVFRVATLLRPDPDRDPGFDIYMAPMILQERSSEDGPATSSIGALVRDGAGALRVDMTRPVVYFQRDRIVLNGVEHDRMAYLWCHSRDRGSTAGPAGIGGMADVQGLRLTLGSGGFPAIQEVLRDPAGFRILHVSESLEKAATALSGSSLPGSERRFAVESDDTSDLTPRPVVARVMKDGPVPMGPFVYLLAGTHEVATLLCRCAAVQFDSMADDVKYELVPLESLRDVGIEAPAWSPKLLDDPAPAPPVDGAWLEKALRLPPEF